MHPTVKNVNTFLYFLGSVYHNTPDLTNGFLLKSFPVKYTQNPMNFWLDHGRFSSNRVVIVSDPYLLYTQAVLQLSFSDQIHPGIQGPLVWASEDDVRSIEPGHSWHFVINVTPEGMKRGSHEKVARVHRTSHLGS